MPPHRDLLTDVLSAGARYPLVLAGDCAVRAHGLTPEASREASREAPAEPPLELALGLALELATENPEPMEQIAAMVRHGLTERGWLVRPLETDPLSTRLLVTDPDTGEERTVDLVKETFWRPPVTTALGPTLSLEDLIGTKVRALTDRGTARDLIDVHTAASHWSFPDLEELGRRHAWDELDLADLQSRLEATELLDDREFTARGLADESVPVLRRWARSWADDIAERLLEEEALRPPADADE
ncbi:nucleotidyl transferase AbiEii/AbiGii toxin family protein [Streptomyces sp. CA-251387]|uniref:nucleotidyl transferase AbiEii/AbiGii toxin family protein n=1 Tax=Streptomyces sp. CA-251387 TaxID=3240064 RepID=UPI003D928159